MRLKWMVHVVSLALTELLAQEHVRLALASYPHHHDKSGQPPTGLNAEELAQQMKDDPLRWEDRLR